MIWNYAEGDPFSDASGSLSVASRWLSESLRRLPASLLGEAGLRDAKDDFGRKNVLISTDPPYYDNIGYADLSDFFYVWLRPNLRDVYPDVFSRILTPKTDELTAIPFRLGGDRKKGREFFEAGAKVALKRAFAACSDDYPLTIYYAHKQSASRGRARDAAASGWETMLSALIEAGFAIVGAWPVLTEKSNRPLGLGVNSLSSSVVLVCRKRPKNAGESSRANFLKILRKELRPAILSLTEANISPADLPQAAIGPGMAVFSRFDRVFEADGSPMSVRTALSFINDELDKNLSGLEDRLDKESSLCFSIFFQAGFNNLDFGQADLLARAKNASVEKITAEGVAVAEKGFVRLLRPEEMSIKASQVGAGVWRLTQLLAGELKSGGILACAKLAVRPDFGEIFDLAKSLSYRLFDLCERRGWPKLAFDYESLVQAFPEIQAAAHGLRSSPLSSDPK
jgi:putative DNA methylase